MIVHQIGHLLKVRLRCLQHVSKFRVGYLMQQPLELGQLLVEALSIALQLFRLLDVLQQTPVDQLETIVYLPLAVLQLMQLGKRAAGSLNQGLV